MIPKNASPLLDGEFEIVDRSEMLHRQIHPQHVRQGMQITTAVFWSGDGMVSTYRTSVVSAVEAHRVHTQESQLKSVGSCVVSVGDVQVAELRVVDDSALPNVHPAHAYIDMRHLDNKAKDKAKKKLKRAALNNPIWYPPENMGLVSGSHSWILS